MSRGNRALDITLAIKSRAKYAAMLTREDKRRICSLTSQDELVAYLARTRGWREATKALPVAAATDEQFSAALDQEVLGDFEALYRMASETSKDFLKFLTLDEELKAITEALRRLTSGSPSPPPDKAPPALRMRAVSRSWRRCARAGYTARCCARWSWTGARGCRPTAGPC